MKEYEKRFEYVPIIRSLPTSIEKDGQKTYLTIRFEPPGVWFAGYARENRDGSEESWGYRSMIIEEVLDKLYDKYGTGRD